MEENHELYMRRALELATLGAGHVSPNPLVGCVIVANGQIIGEGWHKRYGQAHAEVNAVNSVTNKELLPESTVYVTLEPCSHFGKTPPCADLLVNSGVRCVVVCNYDPNPLVAGKGLEKLRAAGIEVITGILEAEGRALNRRFFCFMEKKRPYITLKWAQTPDGFVARQNFDSKWISNALARKLVHKWRTEEDAIIVGTQTAFYDNPRLNARDWQGRNPVRVVLDWYNRLPHSLHLFDGKQRTLILCKELPEKPLQNVEYIALRTQRASAKQIGEALYQYKIQSVVVEGGSQLLEIFIHENYWDEAAQFVGNENFGKGIAAPILSQIPICVENIKENQFFRYKNTL